MLVLVLDWTQCPPQGASAHLAMTGRIRWIQFAQSLLTVAHQPRAGCIRLVLRNLIIRVIDFQVVNLFWTPTYKYKVTVRANNDARNDNNEERSIVLTMTVLVDGTRTCSYDIGNVAVRNLT